jgi:Heavy metal associated domain 2
MISSTDFKGQISAANVVRGGACVPAPEIEIVHRLPGRVRIRAAWLKGNAGAGQDPKRRLAEITGVKAVTANTSTGSLLVEYDPATVAPGKIIDALGASGCSARAAKSVESTRSWVDELASSIGHWLVQAAAERLVLAVIAAVV